MSYSLQFDLTDTIATGSHLNSGETSFTLTSGNFGSPSGTQIYVVDYDIPASAEIISASIAGTAVTSVTRGLTGGAAGTTNHAAGAKVGVMFVPQHYAALQPVSATTNTFVDSALDDGLNVTNTTGSWTDITGLTQTVTTRGGNVDVKFAFPFDNTTAAGTTLFRIVDTISAVATTKAKFSANPGSVGPRIMVSGTVTLTGLAAGSHATKMQMQILAGGGATARAFYGQSAYTVTEQSS